MLSYSSVWEDTAAMLRANAGLLTAIAGVFLFLPAVLQARYLPPPERTAEAAEWIDAMAVYFTAHWPWLLLAALVNMVGIVAIYLLLLAAPRLTVGGAVTRALPILPFFALMSMALNLAVGLGLLMLIVPGVYLLGRLVLASPVLVAETPRAPWGAFERAWGLSRGRGWTIALLMVVVYAVASLVGFAVTRGLGVALLLLLGREGPGALLLAFLEATVASAFTLVATVLTAAIYRALTARADLTRRFA